MLISIRLGWEMVSEASFKRTRNNLYGFGSVYLSKCLVTCMGVQSVWWDSFLSPFPQHVNRARCKPPLGLGSRAGSVSGGQGNMTWFIGSFMSL